MKRSTDRIRTTHAGRLPIPPGCEDMPFRLFRGETVDPAVIDAGIDQVVRQQLDVGIDCIGDGEFWKARNFAYFSRHFTGVATRPLKPGEPPSTRVFTRERDEFAQFYKDLDATGTIFHVPGEKPMPPERERVIATGPVKIEGTAALGAGARHVQGRDRAGRAAGGRDASSACSRPAGSITSSTTSTTRPTRNSCSRSPKRCARNISRWSMPASSCRSTIPGCRTGGT